MKKQLILLSLLPLALTSCDFGSNDFYGKTFVYRQEVVYNFDVAATNYGETTLAKVLDDQIKANNINWETSGGIASSGVTPFEKHGNYNEVVGSMRDQAIGAFNGVYKDFSFTVGSKEDKKFTMKQGEEVKEFRFENYENQDEVLLLYEGEKRVGELSFAPIYGHGVRNGVFETVSFTYNGVKNSVGFYIEFLKEVTVDTVTAGSMELHMWAKISN